MDSRRRPSGNGISKVERLDLDLLWIERRIERRLVTCTQRLRHAGERYQEAGDADRPRALARMRCAQLHVLTYPARVDARPATNGRRTGARSVQARAASSVNSGESPVLRLHLGPGLLDPGVSRCRL